MIISPEGKRFNIKQNVELSENVTQLLIDSEAFFAGMGLGFQLRCIPCMRQGDTDGAYCEGDVNDACTEFKVTCGCRVRTGKGDFTAPVAPPMPARRDNSLIEGGVRTESLTRDQMKQIQAFETVLGQLQLQYLVRCLRCQMNGDQGGVHGVNHDGNKNDFHMTCACTDRVYLDATSPVLTH